MSDAEISYVLPVRWSEDDDLEELTAYLRRIAGPTELVVVDGSPEPLFSRHASAWEDLVKHLRPDPDIHAPMGKVGGVLTGVRAATHDKVVIADDDVRYDESALDRVSSLLDRAECVRPQNYFDQLPWHARWDTARTLLNRSLGADFPGTLGVRRRFLLDAGGYDGDVIFENLELMRTVRAAGGEVTSPLNLYVARRPPSSAHFRSQRVRQAFDDFAIPVRMAAWLSVLPLCGVAVATRRTRWIAGAAAALIGLAEIGRRKGGGGRFFPASSSLLAPGWVAERGLCSWLALWQKLTLGGVRYGSSVVPRSASSERSLRRRFAADRPEPFPPAPLDGVPLRVEKRVSL